MIIHSCVVCAAITSSGKVMSPTTKPQDGTLYHSGKNRLINANPNPIQTKRQGKALHSSTMSNFGEEVELRTEKKVWHEFQCTNTGVFSDCTEINVAKFSRSLARVSRQGSGHEFQGK